MECFCIDEYLLLISNDDILVLESDRSLFEFGLNCILLFLFVLKIFLFLMSEEPIQVLGAFKYVLNRRKFHVLHLYHYFQFPIMQNLLHVRYLFEFFLYKVMSIFLQFGVYDFSNISLLQFGHVALVVNFLDPPDYCYKRIIDFLNCSLFKIFSSRWSNYCIGARTSIENTFLQVQFIH